MDSVSLRVLKERRADVLLVLNTLENKITAYENSRPPVLAGFREWYAFGGGEEMAVSRDDSAKIWDAAVLDATGQMGTLPTCSCGKAGYSALCKKCFDTFLQCQE